jgi:DNA-binding response OmpR family regulator
VNPHPDFATIRRVKILVVEDESKVARFLKRVLSEEGYIVDICSNGGDAIRQAHSGYELIVLDWMLPDVDGLEVCRTLRRSGTTIPILMLTARGEVSERVLGLESGADDYLVKPFELDEFIARVRALLRRSVGFVKLKFGPLEIDRLTRKVTIDGIKLDLTAREYALLLHLAHHPDQVVSKSALLSQVWDTSFDPGSNLVEVQVSRLREKLGNWSALIETVRGIGYRLHSGIRE